jgi:hypothetical protein
MAGLLAGLACGPVQPPTAGEATENSCPRYPCAAYVQGDVPECVGGACLVPQADFTTLVVVVDIPDDNALAPGQTYAVPLDDNFLRNPALESPVVVVGNFVVRPDQTQSGIGVGFNLGNPGTDTVLPMHATFRRLWSLGGGTAPVEASALGLPLLPVAVDSVPFPQNDDPGPDMTTSFDFLGVLPPGLYERTITPDSPLDQVFPPDVNQVPVSSSGGAGPRIGLQLDTTKGTNPTGMSGHPEFCIARSNGSLDGWSAYLRDVTTKRPISNVRSLSGSPSCTINSPTTVTLFTDHHPTAPAGAPDALQNAQLAIVPPAGAPIPTLILTPFQYVLASDETYPELPEPVVVQGTVSAAHLDGGEGPEPAQLIFEATGIYNDGVGAGPASLDTTDFEFTTQTSTDPGGNYKVELPAGEYRVTVRPGSVDAEVSVFPLSVTPGSSPTRNFTLLPQQPVNGLVMLADGRPLAGAAVALVPAQCTLSVGSSWCLPRAPAPTTTASDGTFTLAADEGSYFLRVSPAGGAHLPWGVQQILVTPGGVQASMTVPAPFYAPLSITLEGSPVINALVRVYDTAYVTPETPVSAEVFRAMTDTSGHVDLYLAPPTQ